MSAPEYCKQVFQPLYHGSPAVSSSEAEDPEYLYIAREGKLGILYWHREKHWYRTINDYHRIIQCEYDRIEKKNDMFVCYKDSERVFIDKKGNILK